MGFDWKKCAWNCGNKIDKNNPIEIEHFIPLSKGGKNDSSNKYPCCMKCNRGIGGKFDKDVLKWAITKFGYFKAISIIIKISNKLQEIENG